MSQLLIQDGQIAVVGHEVGLRHNQVRAAVDVKLAEHGVGDMILQFYGLEGVRHATDAQHLILRGVPDSLADLHRGGPGGVLGVPEAPELQEGFSVAVGAVVGTTAAVRVQAVVPSAPGIHFAVALFVE